MLGVCVGRQPIAVHRAALSSHDAARSQERNHVTKVTFLQPSPLFQFGERGTPRSNRPYRENESFLRARVMTYRASNILQSQFQSKHTCREGM